MREEEEEEGKKKERNCFHVRVARDAREYRGNRKRYTTAVTNGDFVGDGRSAMRDGAI